MIRIAGSMLCLWLGGLFAAAAGLAPLRAPAVAHPDAAFIALFRQTESGLLSAARHPPAAKPKTRHPN